MGVVDDIELFLQYVALRGLGLFSDYSKKRMELYQTGELRGEKGAICRMVDGMICKPCPRR